MSKIVSLNLSEKLSRKLDELSREKNVSKSQLANTLLELGLQKQQALDLAQDTKLDKLKLELETKLDNLKDNFTSKLNQTKNELSLDFSYKFGKLEDRLDELQSKLDEISSKVSYIDEILYHTVFAQKIVANIALNQKLTKEQVEQIKQFTIDVINQYKQAKQGGGS